MNKKGQKKLIPIFGFILLLSGLLVVAGSENEPPKKPKDVFLPTSHTFADGTIGYEDFNVTFENGRLKVIYLNDYIELIPFTEKNTIKTFISLSKENLPFHKKNKVSYEYNITTPIGKDVSNIGFEFNTSLKNIEVEDDEIRFGDGENFEIILSGFEDIINEGMEYTLSKKEIKIDTKEKTSINIDPSIEFTTEGADVQTMTPLERDKFVMAWCDEVDDDIEFKIYDTNGTQIGNQVTVDSDVGNCYRTCVSATSFNSSTFVIAYFDNAEDDITFAIYDSEGNELVAPTDVDENVGDSRTVSVSAFNSSTFVIGWTNVGNNDIMFQIYDSSGNSITEPIVANPYIGSSSEAVSVSAFNSSTFVIGYYDRYNEYITFQIYDSGGNELVEKVNVDEDVHYSFTAVVSALDSSTFVIAYYDDTDEDYTFAIYDSGGNELVAPTDVDTNITEGFPSISVSALNSSTFVIGYFDDNPTIHSAFKIYDSSGNNITGPIDAVGSSAMTGVHIKSSEVATGQAICDENFVFSYLYYIIDSYYANWTSYQSNGTSWDGICPLDITPPTVTQESPADDYYETSSNTIDFKYNVADASRVDCDLMINNEINDTQYNPVRGITNTFSVYLNNGDYWWAVNCTDTSNNVGGSGDWNISIDYELLLDITDPTTENPKVTSGGNNITITFDYVEGGTNKTSDVTMENVTIGGSFAEIQTAITVETDYSSRTCSEVWGFDCGEQPDEDNTHDDCPTGTSSYMWVNNIFLNATEITGGDTIKIDCEFDPYDTGTEEYIYIKYPNNSWSQLYAGQAPSGDLYNRTIDFTTPLVEGIYWVRCISDYDGENDECASSGSYYDNDDLSFTVVGDTTIQQFGYVADVGWQVNVTVPTDSFEGLQDLFVNATYNGFTRSDTQTNAISYPTEDTCTYPGSGDWNVECSDNCTISSPVTGDGSNLNIGGTGVFNINADITGFSIYHIEGDCKVHCDGGCFKQ